MQDRQRRKTTLDASPSPDQVTTQFTAQFTTHFTNRFTTLVTPSQQTVVGYVGLGRTRAVGARYGTPLYVHLRGQEGRPGTNPESRRSLVPRVPDPEKCHMLLSTSTRRTQRQTHSAPGNDCGRRTHQQAADSGGRRTPLCAHHWLVRLARAWSLLSCAPSEGRQAAHWENWYVRLHKRGGPARDIDSMSTPRPTQRAQPFRRITEKDALIRWLGGLQGWRTAVRDVERNSALKESYDQRKRRATQR